MTSKQPQTPGGPSRVAPRTRNAGPRPGAVTRHIPPVLNQTTGCCAELGSRKLVVCWGEKRGPGTSLKDNDCDISYPCIRGVSLGRVEGEGMGGFIIN